MVIIVATEEEHRHDPREELLPQHVRQQVARHQHVRRPELRHQRVSQVVLLLLHVKLHLHQPDNQVVLVHQHARQVRTIPPNPGLHHRRLQREHHARAAVEVQVIVVAEVQEAVAAMAAAVPEEAEAVEAEGDN